MAELSKLEQAQRAKLQKRLEGGVLHQQLDLVEFARRKGAQ